MIGTWTVRAIDDADVRLRSGRIGLISVDVTAPVTSGRLQADASGVALQLRIALDRLRTANFIMQAAARRLVVGHQAQGLVYDGRGPSGDPWTISGQARAGDVAVQMDLRVTPVGPPANLMAEIELTGSANVGTVHLPLPGMGTVENFSFDVDARLALVVHT